VGLRRESTRRKKNAGGKDLLQGKTPVVRGRGGGGGWKRLERTVKDRSIPGGPNSAINKKSWQTRTGTEWGGKLWKRFSQEENLGTRV